MKINNPEVVKRLKDPKFYLENFCKIKGKQPGKLIPFILNDAQKDLFNTVRKRSRVIILKSRQIGFSTAMTGYYYHKTITNPGTTTALIGYNSDLTSELLDKVKTFYKTTPAELRPTIQYNSKYEISFPRIDSKILVLPSTENVGRGYTLSNALCVSGKTEVFLRNGFSKRVEEVRGGDFIVNGNGGLSKIKKVVKKKNNKRLLRFKITGTEDLVVTEDHKILIRGDRKSGFIPTWKRAMDIVPGERIGYPYFQCRNRFKKIKISNSVNEKYLSRSANCSDDIDINYDFGVFCGWYLSEGTAMKERVHLSIHQDEVNYVLGMINKSVGKNVGSVKVHKSKTSKTAIVTLYGKNFANFITETFGRLSDGKFIPDKIWYWGWQFGYGLLFGLFSGDGYLKRINRSQLTSVNEQMIYQVKKLLISLRIGLASINHHDTKRYGVNTKHRYDLILSGKANYKFRRKMGFELPIYDNGRMRYLLNNIPGVNQGYGSSRKGKFYYWSRIEKIDEADHEEYVYDIVLEKNPHSFLTKSGVVHNCTELSAWEKAEEKMMTLEASVPINGSLVIESTPRGMGNLYHRMWMQDNDYAKKEYGWWWGYSEEEIETIRRRMNNPMKFAQEYGLEFLASGRSVFDQEVVNQQRSNILKVGDTYIDPDGTSHTVYTRDNLRIYREPEKDNFYVVGVDTSEGVEGGDYSVATFFNRRTGEEVAMFRGLIPPDRLADKLNEWGRWYNNALMVVEVNNHGLTTLTVLKQLAYPSIYFRPAKFETLGSPISVKMGWRTTKLTRNLLIDDLAQAVRESSLIIHSKEMLDEMSVFVYNDRGDMQPMESFHDDCIFSASMAVQGFKVMYHKPLEQLDYENYLPKNFAY